ncbi:MAG: response regulator [Aggregatilineales bacterium]
MVARILIVDNSEAMRELLELVFTDEGWLTLSYAYPGVDLAMVQRLNPTLIILNFDTMYRGAGWELLQLLKMADATAPIPVVVYSSVAPLSPDTEGYLAARGITVIRMPYAIEAFVLIIRQALTLASPLEMPRIEDLTLPILVIEDNELLRETLAMILQFEGYPVVTAANGLLGLDAVTHGQYRLILLDISMPVMNGIEFLTVYANQPGPHAPVIIVSAQTETLPAGLLPMVIGTINKPYEISHLLMLVKQYAQPA